MSSEDDLPGAPNKYAVFDYNAFAKRSKKRHRKRQKMERRARMDPLEFDSQEEDVYCVIAPPRIHRSRTGAFVPRSTPRVIRMSSPPVFKPKSESSIPQKRLSEPEEADSLDDSEEESEDDSAGPPSPIASPFRCRRRGMRMMQGFGDF